MRVSAVVAHRNEEKKNNQSVVSHAQAHLENVEELALSREIHGNVFLARGQRFLI